MWKKDMVPTLIAADSHTAERKTKKQHSVLSTKMEVRAQCFGKTRCTCLHREKQVGLSRRSNLNWDTKGEEV